MRVVGSLALVCRSGTGGSKFSMNFFCIAVSLVEHHCLLCSTLLSLLHGAWLSLLHHVAPTLSLCITLFFTLQCVNFSCWLAACCSLFYGTSLFCRACLIKRILQRLNSVSIVRDGCLCWGAHCPFFLLDRYLTANCTIATKEAHCLLILVQLKRIPWRRNSISIVRDCCLHGGHIVPFSFSNVSSYLWLQWKSCYAILLTTSFHLQLLEPVIFVLDKSKGSFKD